MKSWKKRQFGERGILVEWPDDFSIDQREEILAMDHLLAEHFQDKVMETVPAYTSLAIYLKNGIDVKDFISELENIEINAHLVDYPSRLVHIPVCYDDDLAPDLNTVAVTNGLTKEEVIHLHASGNYRVQFIGFLPGFPYLTGLDRRLFTARLASPRSRIPAGSIGIGGKQTGIYTMESPGGWNVIGRSPLKFFSTSESSPSLFQPGDSVRFRRIDRAEYDTILDRVGAGRYSLELESYD
jgi:inhibitor of KinA